jgi:polyhydroxyalkanoate synthesis regulator phasin
MAKRKNTLTRFFEDIVDDTKDFVDDLLDRAKDAEENVKDAVVDVTGDDEADDKEDIDALNRQLEELKAKVAELTALQGKGKS